MKSKCPLTGGKRQRAEAYATEHVEDATTTGVDAADARARIMQHARSVAGKGKPAFTSLSDYAAALTQRPEIMEEDDQEAAYEAVDIARQLIKEHEVQARPLMHSVTPA